MSCPIRGLEGRKFGKLTVVKEVKTKMGHINWECLCDCGKICMRRGSSLMAGQTVSCGCAKHVSSNAKDITGNRYTNLLVIRRLPFSQ